MASARKTSACNSCNSQNMLLFHSDSASAAVVMFGCGLIGSAIERAMLRKSNWDVKRYPFPWEADASLERRERLKAVLTDLGAMTSHAASAVHTVWSAGRAGFAATQQQTTSEFSAYQQVVEFSESVQTRLGLASHLHMLSSAGGLFEGVRGINHRTESCPMRPYGDLKAAQEAVAIAATTTSCSIYRPTSVFSTVQPGKRRGLIPTVIWNTLSSQTTSIYGKHDTLRDYIWADDIGDFVADQIAASAALQGRQEFLLATAVPTPISRIIRLIEEMLMRPVPVRYILPKDGNTLDITVSPDSLPKELLRTDLATAIRQIYLRLMSDGMVARG